jgi:hypothetical protein
MILSDRVDGYKASIINNDSLLDRTNEAHIDKYSRVLSKNPFLAHRSRY